MWVGNVKLQRINTCYMPILSIITINYNNCTGLQKTIDSVVKQTWRDFEWFLIDGGSTDGSEKIIEQYHDYFAYWCSEADKGVYDAMNKGIRHATGIYCLFLNSGDWLLNENVLKDVFSKEHSKDILVGWIERMKSGKRILDKGFNTDNITIRHLLRNSLPHQATFIKRKLFDEYGLYDDTLKIVADWKFFVQCIILHNATIENLCIPVTYYEGGGLSDHAENGGGIEWRRSLEEMIPQRIIDDFPLVMSLDDVKSLSLTSNLYRVLYRLTMWLKRRQW